MSQRTMPASKDAMAERLFNARTGPGWDLLTWLSSARYVTVDLVALRFYRTPAGPRTATYRLGELEEWGVIKQRPVRGSRRVWYLTETGAELVADYLQVPVKTFWHEAIWRVSDGHVQHWLQVTQFEVALRAHADMSGGEVRYWCREPEIETRAGILRPDAGFTYVESGRAWHYVVELDRNTEAPGKFVAKLPRYSLLHESAYQPYWESLPACLIVAAAGGRSRAARLQTEIDRVEVAPGAEEYRMFKYVAAEDLYSIPLSTGGRLPEVSTKFNEPVCMASKTGDKGIEVVRRAVFG